MSSEQHWPERWQPEAIQAVAPYVDTDFVVEILVDDPSTAVDGTLLAGYVFVASDGHLQIIHDRSGRPDVYPWRLLAGPVLRVTARRPGGKRSVVFAHPDWKRRRATRR